MAEVVPVADFRDVEFVEHLGHFAFIRDFLVAVAALDADTEVATGSEPNTPVAQILS